MKRPAIHVGKDFVSRGHGRLVQVSAMDVDYVYLYWPHNRGQTKVLRSRFGWPSEWRLPDQDLSSN